MNAEDLFTCTEMFPAEYAANDTFAGFAAALDASKPGKGRLLQHIAATYPGAWEPLYQTFKNHGFRCRAIHMPTARKVSDIFASVSLFPYQTGGVRREDVQYVRAGAAFISTSRAAGFAYFGRLGATYEWAPRHLPKKVRSVRGGTEWLTAAVPTQAAVNAFGAIAGPGEWELATFEIVRQDDGRQLVIGRSNNGFHNVWLALLDADQCALSMLDDHERGEIEAEEARKLEAWADKAGEA